MATLEDQLELEDLIRDANSRMNPRGLSERFKSLLEERLAKKRKKEDPLVDVQPETAPARTESDFGNIDDSLFAAEPPKESSFGSKVIGALDKGIDFLNEPLSNGYFGRLQRERAKELDYAPEGIKNTGGQNPLQDFAARISAMGQGFKRGVFEGVGDAADSLTAPSTWLSLGGAGLASKLTKAPKAAKTIMNVVRGIEATQIPHGIETMVKSDNGLDTFFGALEALGGGVGAFTPASIAPRPDATRVDIPDIDISSSVPPNTKNVTPRQKRIGTTPKQLTDGGDPNFRGGEGDPNLAGSVPYKPTNDVEIDPSLFDDGRPVVDDVAPTRVDDINAPWDDQVGDINDQLFPELATRERTRSFSMDEAPPVNPNDYDDFGNPIPKTKVQELNDAVSLYERSMARAKRFLRDDKGEIDFSKFFQGEDDLGYNVRTNDPDTIDLGNVEDWGMAGPVRDYTPEEIAADQRWLNAKPVNPIRRFLSDESGEFNPEFYNRPGTQEHSPDLVQFTDAVMGGTSPRFEPITDENRLIKLFRGGHINTRGGDSQNFRYFSPDRQHAEWFARERNEPLHEVEMTRSELSNYRPTDYPVDVDISREPAPGQPFQSGPEQFEIPLGRARQLTQHDTPDKPSMFQRFKNFMADETGEINLGKRGVADFEPEMEGGLPKLQTPMGIEGETVMNFIRRYTNNDLNTPEQVNRLPNDVRNGFIKLWQESQAKLKSKPADVVSIKRPSLLSDEGGAVGSRSVAMQKTYDSLVAENAPDSAFSRVVSGAKPRDGQTYKQLAEEYIQAYKNMEAAAAPKANQNKGAKERKTSIVDPNGEVTPLTVTKKEIAEVRRDPQYKDLTDDQIADAILEIKREDLAATQGTTQDMVENKSPRLTKGGKPVKEAPLSETAIPKKKVETEDEKIARLQREVAVDVARERDAALAAGEIEMDDDLLASMKSRFAKQHEELNPIEPVIDPVAPDRSFIPPLRFKNLPDKMKKFLRDEKGEIDFSELFNEKPNSRNVMEEQQNLSVDDLEDGIPIKERDIPELDKPSFARQVWDSTMGVPATDLPFLTSAAFRQASPLAFTKNWFKAWPDAVKSYGSQGAYDAIMAEIRSKRGFQPRYREKLDAQGNVTGYVEQPSLAEKAGIRMTDSIVGGEEALRGRLVEKIPFIGNLVKRSNRSYAAFLNSLRANQFEQMLDQGKWIGNDPAANEKLLETIGETINILTGRASLKGKSIIAGGKEWNLDKVADNLATMIWSPRLLMSRIKMLNPVGYVNMEPTMRKELIKGLFRSGATWAGFAGLASLHPDVTVSWDPNSSDFGKIKIGDTRIDPGASFLQLVVLANRMRPGLIGGTYHSGDGGPFEAKPKDTAERFMANKMHPSARLAYDLMNVDKKNPVHLGDRAVQFALPLMTQDILDVMKEDQALGMAIGPLSSVGLGTQHYSKGDFNKPVYTDDIENLLDLEPRSLAGTIKKW